MMMNCHDLTVLVTEYLEGKLTLWQRMQFDVHVAMCPPCRHFLDQLKETSRVVGHVPPVVLPPEIEAEMLELFEAWTARRAQ